MQARSRALLEQIDPLRSWIVTLLSLLVAVTSLGLAAYVGLVARDTGVFEPSYPGLLLVQGISAAVAGLMPWLGLRAWAARLMAVTLVASASVVVLGFGMPNEIALASYVGAMLVASVALGLVEMLALTSLVVVLGVVTSLREVPQTYLVQTLASVLGLLLSVGMTLAWMLDSLQRTIRGLEASEAHFHRLSHLDPLTGLGNRRQFDLSLGEVLSSRASARGAALVVLDVDNLKSINDQHGHPAGDEALKAVARAITSSIRELDIAARIGGDEFAVILTSGGLRGAQQIAARIEERLRDQLPLGPRGVQCSVSIGLAEADGSAGSAEELLDNADARLYADREHVRKPVEQ